MTRSDDYRGRLRSLAPDDWKRYLLAESALPGPRANLELAQAVADIGDEQQFKEWLNLGPEVAPDDSAQIFLPFCGAIGLGRLVAEGRADLLPTLRASTNDRRWRVREAVVLGLQRLGDSDLPALISAMREWSTGGFLDQRAAVAALCEPRFLRDPAVVRQVLTILDAATEFILHSDDRRATELRVLRQSLGYCWSVLVVALPSKGKPAFERWAASSDPDVRWIIRENLKKSRLRRMDAGWVDRLSSECGGPRRFPVARSASAPSRRESGVNRRTPKKLRSAPPSQ